MSDRSGKTLKQRNRSQTARIAAVVGGACQGALQQIEDLKSDACVRADVYDEIEQQMVSGGSVLTIPLASNHTVATLVSKAPNVSQTVVRHTREHAGADADCGLGAFRPIAEIAARLITLDPAFLSRVNAELYVPLLQKFDGAVRAFQVDVYSGIGGATGSAGGIPFGQCLTEMVLQQSSNVVTCRFLRIGIMSYLGLGGRIELNGVATVSETTDHLVDPNRNDREIRTAEFVELPMVGADKNQRDEFLRQLLRALHATLVEQILRRGFSNDCLTSRYGGARLIRASYYNFLRSVTVSADVARQYIAEAERMLQIGATTGIGEEITVIRREEQLEVPPPQLIGEIVKRAKVFPAGLVESHCVNPSTRFEAMSVQVSVSGEEPISIAAFLATSCKSREEFTHKLGVLLCLSIQLDRHCKEKRRLAQRASAAFLAAKKNVVTRLGWLFPTSLIQKCSSLVSDRAGNIIQLQNQVQILRHRLDEMNRLECDARALDDALTRVLAEIDREQERIRCACRRLAGIAESAPQRALVHAGDINQILAPLLDQMDHDGPDVSEEVIHILSQGVECVTMEGLAEIFGVPDGRPEQIAKAIVHSKPVTVGPPWGGHPWTRTAKRLIAPPPMREEDAGLIQRLVAQIDPNLIVAWADSAKGSINAVLLEITCPQTADEIFTPFLIQHLRKACETPELYFSAGKTGTHWLPENRGERSERCEA